MFELFTKRYGDKTEDILRSLLDSKVFDFLHDYGQAGVNALAAATPKDTGRTASAWYYTISTKGNDIGIQWHNDNINKGAVIAILLQYGHGTGGGGYVVGRDYINPALSKVFKDVADRLVEEVVK